MVGKIKGFSADWPNTEEEVDTLGNSEMDSMTKAWKEDVKLLMGEANARRMDWFTTPNADWVIIM